MDCAVQENGITGINKTAAFYFAVVLTFTLPNQTWSLIQFFLSQVICTIPGTITKIKLSTESFKCWRYLGYLAMTLTMFTGLVSCYFFQGPSARSFLIKNKQIYHFPWLLKLSSYSCQTVINCFSSFFFLLCVYNWGCRQRCCMVELQQLIKPLSALGESQVL